MCNNLSFSFWQIFTLSSNFPLRKLPPCKMGSVGRDVCEGVWGCVLVDQTRVHIKEKVPSVSTGSKQLVKRMQDV